MADKLDRASQIAHLIVAVCAVAGLSIAIWQSAKTGSALEAAAEAFRAQAYPVVKFLSHVWFQQPGRLSCENPAIGFDVLYQNRSGTPVYIEDSSLSVFMGQRPLDFEAEIKIAAEGERILTAGEHLGIGFTNKRFPEIFQRLRGPGPGPHLWFSLEVVYRSLVTGRRYRLDAEVLILDRCDFAEQAHVAIQKEKITKLQ